MSLVAKKINPLKSSGRVSGIQAHYLISILIDQLGKLNILDHTANLLPSTESTAPATADKATGKMPELFAKELLIYILNSNDIRVVVKPVKKTSKK